MNHDAISEVKFENNLLAENRKVKIKERKLLYKPK